MQLNIFIRGVIKHTTLLIKKESCIQIRIFLIYVLEEVFPLLLIPIEELLIILRMASNPPIVQGDPINMKIIILLENFKI